MKWDLYDNELKETGVIVSNEDEIPDGFYHIALEIWIINDKNEILLVKKSLDYSRRYPGCWSCIGGNLYSKEHYKDSVKRIVFEMIGLEIKDNEIELLSPQKRDPYRYAYITCYIKRNVDLDKISFVDGRATVAKYVNINELLNMCNNGEIAFYLIGRIKQEIVERIKN